jgi:hypothetical protein
VTVSNTHLRVPRLNEAADATRVKPTGPKQHPEAGGAAPGRCTRRTCCMLTASRQLSLPCVLLLKVHQCHNVGVSCGGLGWVPRSSCRGVRQHGAACQGITYSSAVAAASGDRVARSACHIQCRHDGVFRAGAAATARNSCHSLQHRGQHAVDGEDMARKSTLVSRFNIVLTLGPVKSAVT